MFPRFPQISMSTQTYPLSGQEKRTHFQPAHTIHFKGIEEDQALWGAVVGKNLPGVEKALEQGADIHQRRPTEAIFSRRANTVARNGARARHPTSLLENAAASSTPEIVRILLDRGAHADEVYENKQPEDFASDSAIKTILAKARRHQNAKLSNDHAELNSKLETTQTELQKSQEENQQRRDRSTERNKELEKAQESIQQKSGELEQSQGIEQGLLSSLKRTQEQGLKQKLFSTWRQKATALQKQRLASNLTQTQGDLSRTQGDLANTQGELSTTQQNLTTTQTELSSANIARLNAEKKHEDLYQKWVQGLETDRDEAQARANRLQEELMQKRIQEAVRTERALGGRAGTVATFADQPQVRTFTRDPAEASSSQSRPRTPSVNNSSHSSLAGDPMAPEPLRIRRRPTRSVSSQSSFGDISLAPDRPEEARSEGSLAEHSDADSLSQAFSDAESIHSTFSRRSSIGSAVGRTFNWVRRQINPQDSSEDEGSVDSTERRPRFKRTARRYRKGENRHNLPKPSSALHAGFSKPAFDVESLTGSESEGGVDYDSGGLKKHYEENAVPGQHPLLDAFFNKNRDEVQRLLRESPESLRQVNKAGETVLHWSALTDNPSAAQYFLSVAGRNAPALANQKTFDGRDALMMTAAQNSVKTTKVLLDHPQAKVNWAATHSTSNRTNDETALHIATRMGHSKVAQVIVPRVDKTALNAFCRQHRTPGMNAAENGLHRTIGAMLDHPEFDPSLQSADSQDAAALAAHYGHKTARAKKGRNQQGKWQTFNRFVKGMGEGKNITLNARDYSNNHDFWQQLSALGYAAISAPSKTFGRALAYTDSNPNQSLFRRIKGQHGFQTLVGLTAQYGRPDNLKILAKIPGIKLRLKTEHSGNDALKIAVQHNQADMIEPINTAITEKTGRPLTADQAMKPNGDRKTVVQIGYENGALESIAALKRTFPDIDTRPTRAYLKAAKKKLTRRKYTAMKTALRSARH